MPTTPADVIAATLRRAGVPDAELHARAVAADLAGHSLLADSPTPRRTKRAKRATGPAPRCRRPVDPHSGTDLIGVRADGTGGYCPACGWSPDNQPAEQQ